MDFIWAGLYLGKPVSDLSRFLTQLRELFMTLHEASRRLARHFKYALPTVGRFSVIGLQRNLQEDSSMLLITSDWLV